MSTRKVYPHGAMVLKEDVVVQYADGPVHGDLIRTAVGMVVLWTGRAVRTVPPQVGQIS